MDERVGFGLTNSVGTWGVLDVCGEWVGGLDQGLEW